MTVSCFILVKKPWCILHAGSHSRAFALSVRWCAPDLYHAVRRETVLKVTQMEFDCGNLVSMVPEAGDRSKSSVGLLNLVVPF